MRGMSGQENARVSRARVLAGAAALMLAGGGTARAQELSAQAAVESETVYVGQPFVFQIQVAGSDTLSEPDVSGLTDFQVAFQGGGSNSSSSVTVVNGRMTREDRRGYIFHYELTAKRPGTLTIPPVSVRDGTREARTQPVQITAREPQEVDDLRLRQELSKSEAYVGEALVLDVTFYHKVDVQDPKLTLPVADMAGFRFFDQPAPQGQETAVLEGTAYRTMRLRKALIPDKAGTYQIPPATLSVQAMVGFRTMQDLFFGPSQRRDFRRFVVPSNGLELRILELPAAGRPKNFAGHVGNYRLEASATPVTANVGDPITLTVSVSGPDFLEQIPVPPLQKQETLVRDFRVPAEAAAGKVERDALVFRQTIRALRADVREIPAIELPFFDPDSKTYRVARSSPIPVDIKATRVVTAGDAEGRDPVARQAAEVQESTGGIAYNYEDGGALRNLAFDPAVWLRSGPFWCLLLLPPAACSLLWLLLRRHRVRMADPGRVREQRAQAVFLEEIASAPNPDEVLTSLRSYLRDRLRLAAGALTFRDVEPALRARGGDAAVLEEVRQVFETCEQSRYAGVRAGDVTELVARSRRIVERIESLGGKPRRLTLARVLSVMLALLPGTGHGALTHAEVKTIFEEGNALFRHANELAPQDAQAAAELYGKAILRFQRIIREGGIENGKLYYNTGNAYFRMNDLGRAILNYRRAEELMPHDANLVRNLAYARQLRADRIEVPGRRRVAEILLFWHYDLTARTKAVVFGWAVLLAWTALGVALWRPIPYLRRTAAGCGAVAILLLGSLLVEARGRAASVPGVVVAQEVIARKGDGLAYEPSFQDPLHAGAEFTLVEQRPGWRQVELEDGRRCWLPEASIELVR